MTIIFSSDKKTCVNVHGATTTVSFIIANFEQQKSTSQTSILLLKNWLERIAQEASFPLSC